jgi:ribosomal protein S18 acetylase RimI-like enzyme
MIRSHRITTENIHQMQAIYGRFELRAKTEYRWAYDPISFDEFKLAIAQHVLAGYWVEDTSVEDAVGFLLYCQEAHRAIEINVIYSELEDKKAILDKLLIPFIHDVRQLDGWDVISYAMLGEQEHFIRTISWYGFKPVGQAIVEFDILDSISLQILQQQKLPPLSEEFTLDSWQPQYAGGISASIFEAFSQTADAFWDPRFRTLPGAKEVVATLTSGMMGKHIPECTSVALQNGVPVGFCFLVEAGDLSGNIPLIGLRPDVKRQGLGLQLLQRTLAKGVQAMLDSQVNLIKVTATLDTDNIPAIKMYRRLGFRETCNYPHVYMTREKAMAFKQGKWC